MHDIFLSPDMLRSEPTDTQMGSGSEVELRTERFAMAYRLLLFAYAFVRLASEQNCSLSTSGGCAAD
jgi:hypothetical protein